MKQLDYSRLEDFFSSYTARFVDRAGNPAPFQVKITHTQNVCDNMKILARSQGWSGDDHYTALAAALLHDIGRFPQYEAYGTYSDSQSENHGALGAEVIRKEGILSGIEKPEQQKIIRSVALHNAFRLPDGVDRKTLELTRLVRDADKLDIYRVMIDLYRGSMPGKTSFITHYLPDDGRISDDLIRDIENRKLLDARDVVTLNDMKLLQISWIFDLNFPVSLDLVRQRRVVETILSTMPQSAALERVGKASADYLRSA